MVKERKAVEISGMPELLRLAEDVQVTNEPCVLRRDGKEIAAVVPLKPARRRGKAKSEADYEALRSAAGGWRGLVDADKLIEDIYESRRMSSRPPVEL